MKKKNKVLRLKENELIQKFWGKEIKVNSNGVNFKVLINQFLAQNWEGKTVEKFAERCLRFWQKFKLFFLSPNKRGKVTSRTGPLIRSQGVIKVSKKAL